MRNKAEQWDYIAPYPGAQLRVRRRILYHYGIYIGGDTVIEFGNGYEDAPVQKEEVAVQSTTLKDFLCGGRPEVRIYCRAEKRQLRPADQIITAARAALGERGYDIQHNNCKHFADRCVFKIRL